MNSLVSALTSIGKNSFEVKSLEFNVCSVIFHSSMVFYYVVVIFDSFVQFKGFQLYIPILVLMELISNLQCHPFDLYLSFMNHIFHKDIMNDSIFICTFESYHLVKVKYSIDPSIFRLHFLFKIIIDFALHFFFEKKLMYSLIDYCSNYRIDNMVQELSIGLFQFSSIIQINML